MRRVAREKSIRHGHTLHLWWVTQTARRGAGGDLRVLAGALPVMPPMGTGRVRRKLIEVARPLDAINAASARRGQARR